jgi:hypothetical protein
MPMKSVRPERKISVKYVQTLSGESESKSIVGVIGFNRLVIQVFFYSLLYFVFVFLREALAM